ncbi:hypothetical protein Q3G72_014832 [Acer saccharum]|nr:hypothetical protein Q3G72_014832 [Acer saccharum]
MIGGYAINGQPRNVLELYKSFKEQGIKPDETFILGIISACSQLRILDTAESIIHDFSEPSFFPNLRVVNSLIDMYAKCGSIERAKQVFEMAHQKDLLCYSTMIAAFANNGLGQDAISLFDEMQRANITPDGVAFLGVLTACNHGGLVNAGKMFFKQMIGEYGIQPSEKYYACVVDLLGCSGCLDEAHNIIKNMPIAPHSAVWGALLAACRVHCNVQLAEVASAELFKIEPYNSVLSKLLRMQYWEFGHAIQSLTWYVEVNMDSAAIVRPLFNSLQAFWPELQVLAGDIDPAIQTHAAFFSVWKRYGFTPEGFNLATLTVQVSETRLLIAKKFVLYNGREFQVAVVIVFLFSTH